MIHFAEKWIQFCVDTGTNQFETLETVLSLTEAGRVNAALSVWKSLDDTFRRKVLQFTLYCVECDALPSVDVVLQTDYGKLRINEQTIKRLRVAIPEVARAYAAGAV